MQKKTLQHAPNFLLTQNHQSLHTKPQTELCAMTLLPFCTRVKARLQYLLRKKLIAHQWLTPMKNAPTSSLLMHGFGQLNGRHWMITREVVLIVVTWHQPVTCPQRRQWHRAFRWRIWCRKRQSITVASGQSQLSRLLGNMQRELRVTFSSSPDLFSSQISLIVKALASVRCMFQSTCLSWCMTKTKTRHGRIGT